MALDDDGVLGVGLVPDFEVDQPALWLPTDARNILHASSVGVVGVRFEAVDSVRRIGGIGSAVAVDSPWKPPLAGPGHRHGGRS